MLPTAARHRFSIAMILAFHWQDFVAQYRRWIRPAVFDNVRRVLACRTPALGCHVYLCDACGEVRLIPHSCKSRFCPTCGKHATDVWADKVLNDLLPVHYHHLVMGVPFELRPIFHLNRREGFNLLFTAAIRSVQDWARDVKGMRCGIIAVLHTFGSDLKFHPHLHLIVTGGGLSLDGQQWIATDPRFLMNHSGLKKRWKYQVLKGLREAHRAGKLRFPAKAAYLKNYSCFNSFLNRLYQMTWYAHIGASLLDPRFSVRYIGRYTKRAVLAEYRVTHYDGKTVRFRFKDYAEGGKISYKTLSVFSFIARLTQHIPDKGFPMIRHAGIFATRWKSRYLAQARVALGQSPSSETASPGAPGDTEANSLPLSLKPWRERQQEYTGQDPLLCSRCQTPLRPLGAFFGSHQELAWLFMCAGVPFRPQRSKIPMYRGSEVMLSFLPTIRMQCNQCGDRFRVSLQRMHALERQLQVPQGEPLLLECHMCHAGVVVPSPYRSVHGDWIRLQPDRIPKNTRVISF